MTNQSPQRKKPFAQLDSLLPLLSLLSLIQFQFLMAGTAANLVQTDLLLALGATPKARFTARFGTRSSLHSIFLSLSTKLTSPERQRRALAPVAGAPGWL